MTILVEQTDTERKHYLFSHAFLESCECSLQVIGSEWIASRKPDDVRQIFSLDCLYALHQVHGTELVRIQTENDIENYQPKNADGFVIPNLKQLRMELHGRTLGLLIRTADCLPVTMFSSAGVAFVHAGWRGLTSSILEKALLSIVATSQEDEKIAVFIGPSASGRCYEVGSDVFELAGPHDSIASRSTSGKFLLDLSKSAEQRVRALRSNVEVFSTGLCTIRDPRFYSYRRSPEEKGRNLNLLVIRGLRK